VHTPARPTFKNSIPFLYTGKKKVSNKRAQPVWKAERQILKNLDIGFLHNPAVLW
jgi:hypothetical protein